MSGIEAVCTVCNVSNFSVSGCSDYYAANEDEAIRMARELLAFLYRDERVGGSGEAKSAGQPSGKAKAKAGYEEPLYDASELNGLLPNVWEEGQDTATRRGIVYQILARLVDGSRVHEFRTTYGDGAVCAFAEIGGHRVGLVANTGRVCAATAAKCTHFVQLCAMTFLAIGTSPPTITAARPE